jgi:hypothetical protein
MKKFVARIAVFGSLTAILLWVALLNLPNPVVKTHMLNALTDKYAMLRKITVHKIIFIGGSSVAYSLDSKRIQDALNMPVMNAGLNASLGMKFYLTDIKPYINEGDIIVVAPEYTQYHTDMFYGNMDLVSTLFDVHNEGQKSIDTPQWFHLMQFMPFYAASKILLLRNRNPPSAVDVYGRKAFNSFGDAYLHWDLPGKKFKVAQKSKEGDRVNAEAIQLLTDFYQFVRHKKATMLLLPPVFQSSSFANQKSIIEKIYREIKANELPVIAEPERYKFPDSVFFDSNYHLLRAGVERRSDLVIEDIKAALPDYPF